MVQAPRFTDALSFSAFQSGSSVFSFLGVKNHATTRTGVQRHIQFVHIERSDKGPLPLVDLVLGWRAVFTQGCSPVNAGS